MKQIQFITHPSDRFTFKEEVEMVLRGGCRWIQLRMKDADDDEVERVALDLQPLCKQYNATFILDDRVQLVQKVGADGVHLGKKDMPVDEARKMLGSSFIIGGTANTMEDIRRLSQQGADYIGCGPFRFTTTKKNLSPILGLEGYRTMMETMKKEEIQIPVVAIGGITLHDVNEIMQTGVSGIAISGAILTAENPEQAMREMINSIEELKQ